MNVSHYVGWGGVGVGDAPSRGYLGLGPALLADVLPGENLPAGLAFEAAQVPLLVQG